MTRFDSAASRTDSAQAGQKSPVTAGIDGRFALVGVGQVAGVVHQFRRAANWTFHVHSSLKDTISTSSMTVSFRYTSPAGVLGRYTSCQTV